MTSPSSKAIEAKGTFRWLDRLVPDAALARVLERDPEANELAGPLTFAGCLLHHHYRDPFSPHRTLVALDSNLGALWDKIDKPGQLRNKLLNPGQFLNTISELALARTLRDCNYEVTLEYEFAESRDADVLASKNGHDYHIDVTNLAGRPLASGRTIWGSMSEVTERDIVIKKIATKFRKKFEGPLSRGWCGHPWIALDVAKNDLENVETVLRQFTHPTWCEDLKAILHRECPTLEGALIYRSGATATHVDIMGCVECSV